MPNQMHAVAHKLSSLPPELVHEVLSDLPLSKVLELLSVDELPYLHTCVLTHIHLGKIFTSEDTLQIIKRYFTLYLCLHERPHAYDRRFTTNPDIPYLQQDAYAFILRGQYDPRSTHSVADQHNNNAGRIHGVPSSAIPIFNRTDSCASFLGRI